MSGNTNETDGLSQGSLLPIIFRFVKRYKGNRRAEGLEQLCKQLKLNREEIATMLVRLDEGRGFSEEASTSILHQLVVRLLEISFSRGKMKCIQNQ